MLYHYAHDLGNSMTPILMSFCSLLTFSSLLIWFKYNFMLTFFVSSLFSFLIIIFWSKDTTYENLCGFHNFLVLNGLKMSFILFLFSEIMFFFSIFWMFFDISLSPGTEIGGCWPPYSIEAPYPLGLPFLGTCILLSSGCTATWAHMCLLSSNSVVNPIFFTLMLATLFLFIQYTEYNISSLSMSDSVYGTIFFFSTGFHGFHVLVGTLYITFCLILIYLSYFNFINHSSFEFSLLYWHFVDLVWLFLFIFVYCWGY